MEPLYGPGTDPMPYFALAFGLGTLGLTGFFAWIALERRRLRTLLVAVHRPSGSQGPV
jgi:hypothetical protein